MSKIGNLAIAVPRDVKVAVDTAAVRLDGPKGKLFLNIPSGVKVEQAENILHVKRLNELKMTKAKHGTVRAIIFNMIEGVTKGYKKSLEIQGVGFRGQLQGAKLLLNLGFSHPVEYLVPKEVKVSVPTQTEIHIEGVDKALVGLVAAQIRALKPPEPYKGKGIRYSGEVVRRKQGKSVTK